MKNRLIGSRIAAVVTAVAVLAAGAGAGVAAAAPNDEMTVTFIRHGQSAGNSSGKIDTSIPGPGLTDKGRAESEAIAKKYADRHFDGVYASTMIRTQLTAKPTADLRRQPVVVEEGIYEIQAGDYEGTPEADALKTFYAAPMKWMAGDLAARMPGGSNGYEFDKRVDDALERIAKSGKKNPVVFSHGATIMVWTMMNVTDPDMKLFETQRLKNTGTVVVKGSKTKGWKLISWVAKP